MHVRRALLLFALVLGLAALAAAVSQPPREPRSSRPGRTPSAVPGPGSSAARVVELPAGKRRPSRLEVGRPATVLVQVREPGEVAIPQLGLIATADRLTPARFELLPERAGRHRVIFRPAGGGDTRTIGDLLVLGE